MDDLVVDVQRQRVVRGRDTINLSPLSFELLLALVHAAPGIVSADELMRRVWPGLVVSPETVSQRVKLVRHALGDEAAAPRYIAGIRGRGYRLVPPVSVIDGSDPDGRDGTRTDAPPAAGSSDPSRPAQARPAPAPGIPGRGRHPCSLSLVLAVLVLAAALYELGEGTLGAGAARARHPPPSPSGNRSPCSRSST